MVCGREPTSPNAPQSLITYLLSQISSTAVHCSSDFSAAFSVFVYVWSNLINRFVRFTLSSINHSYVFVLISNITPMDHVIEFNYDRTCTQQQYTYRYFEIEMAINK